MTVSSPAPAAATAPDAAPGTAVGRGRLRLVAHQIRYEQLSFWRNPQAVIFTFLLPVLVVTVFGAVFGGDQKSDFYFGLSGMQYYTPTIAAVSVLGACYGQLAIVLSTRRQTGMLKRLRATPLPAWIYFTGLLAHCLLVGAIDIGLVIGVGTLYGVPLPAHWAGLALALVLGAASFCALGAGVASLVRSAESAPALVQFIQFPLVFISGSYFPVHADALNTIAGLLPVKPFNEALLAAFTGASGHGWRGLGVLAAWGVLGAVVAVRRFRWDPRPE
ncbi:ABC transporter permease [Streptomyces olivaceus]|uniref:ABC transporter permease n=1 Tax=Streptomyces TaxID=1883 RepID=UPI001413B895|nr:MULTISPECIES: ABC transporter permease [Streptomyces]MBZ6283549.1 ABC transporter permease [Streptomyces olivaceus]MBZ6295510.1 ABC transporter permease [Streptomyces olivaceus]MBZ6330468.1 ABC transporter permease [Streptomyces olivaceus]MCC2270659.1 ABC transporter permease [Streptomyces sp. CT1-17]QIP71289.1 ABC transporter permease [Streptomyces sp. VN1]